MGNKMPDLKRGELRVTINYNLALSLIIAARNLAKRVIEQCDKFEKYLDDIAAETGGE